MSIQTITNPIVHKKMDYKKAFAALANDSQIAQLDPFTIDAIRYMVAKAAIKEKSALKPNENPFKLASLFMAKKDPRYYLCGIHATGKQLMACNGHIVIVVDHECDEGVYDALGMAVPDSSDWKLPNFSRYFDLNYESIDYLNGDESMVHDTPTRLIGDTKFSIDYLNLIKRINPKETKLSVETMHVGKIFQFIGDNFKGVLMPLMEK